jgi:hypothetical protein
MLVPSMAVKNSRYRNLNSNLRPLLVNMAQSQKKNAYSFLTSPNEPMKLLDEKENQLSYNM